MLTRTSISGCLFFGLGDNVTKFPHNRLAIKPQGLSSPAKNIAYFIQDPRGWDYAGCL